MADHRSTSSVKVDRQEVDALQPGRQGWLALSASAAPTAVSRGRATRPSRSSHAVHRGGVSHGSMFGRSAAISLKALRPENAGLR